MARADEMFEQFDGFELIPIATQHAQDILERRTIETAFTRDVTYLGHDIDLRLIDVTIFVNI